MAKAQTKSAVKKTQPKKLPKGSTGKMLDQKPRPLVSGTGRVNKRALTQEDLEVFLPMTTREKWITVAVVAVPLLVAFLLGAWIF